MLVESYGRIEVQESRLAELEQHVIESVYGCAETMMSHRIAAKSERGVRFFHDMLSRIAQMGEFSNGKLNVGALHNLAIERAEAIDSGSDRRQGPVWKKTSEGGLAQFRVKNEVELEWLGLLAELPVMQVLEKLDLGDEWTLVRRDDEMMAKFDRTGKADFLLLDEEEKLVVGIQVKRFSGRNVQMFRVEQGDEAEELKRVIERLKKGGVMSHNVSVVRGWDNLALETKRSLGEEYRAVLVYVLVGNKTVDRKNGLFVEDVRQEVGEAMAEVVEGKRQMAKIDCR